MLIDTQARKLGTLALLVAFGTAACASGQPPQPESTPQPTGSDEPDADEVLKNAPDWYTAPPEDSLYVTATATEVSRDLQLAVDKAQTSGRAAIAEQLSARYQQLTKDFQEEVGLAPDSKLLSQYTNAVKAVTDQVLSGSKTRKREVVAEGDDAFRAYVLMELPLGEANRALLEQMQNYEEMYTRFRGTQAFEELEEAIEASEERREEAEAAIPPRG